MGDLPELERRIERYRRNRAHLLAALPEVGLTRMAPADGAFYLYLDVAAFTDDSVQLCRRLLHETGVALTPGVDFDPARGGISSGCRSPAPRPTSRRHAGGCATGSAQRGRQPSRAEQRLLAAAGA